MSISTPGFANPVLDGQACFRAILDAMARPGTIHRVRAPINPPPLLGRATASALLTLLDAGTSLWLDEAAQDAGDWIAFHCGAALAPLDRAAFAVALHPIRLDLLYAGSDDAPEEGATLILQVTALGSGRRFRLSGPGLAAPSEFLADGLGDGFAPAWQANRAMFPRGIDMLLCAGDRLAALPRTVRIEEL